MSDRGKTLQDEAGNNAICPSGNRASEGEGLSRRGRRPEEEKKGDRIYEVKKASRRGEQKKRKEQARGERKTEIEFSR